MEKSEVPKDPNLIETHKDGTPKEFHETDAMCGMADMFYNCDYLNDKDLTDMWCSIDNEKDLRWELSARFEGAFREMQEISKKYSELFGKRLHMPKEQTIISTIRRLGKQLVKDRELKEKWKNSDYLSTVAESHIRQTRMQIRAYGHALRILVS